MLTVKDGPGFYRGLSHGPEGAMAIRRIAIISPTKPAKQAQPSDEYCITV